MLELVGHDGAVRRLTLERVGRGADGPVLEGRCPETGEVVSVPASGVARVRHGDGREEAVWAVVMRWMDRGWWRGRVDRLVILGIVAVAFWAAVRVQGPKDLGLYAVFWSGALWAAGGVVVWAVLRRALGVDRWGR
ncbi:MAG: hypothetical protein ACXIUV_00270 [Alkalilacustris sp.]